LSVLLFHKGTFLRWPTNGVVAGKSFVFLILLFERGGGSPPFNKLTSCNVFVRALFDIRGRKTPSFLP